MSRIGKAIAIALGAISFGVMLVTGALWLLDTQYVTRSEYEELEEEKDYLVCAVRFDPCVCEVVILPVAKQTCEPERR